MDQHALAPLQVAQPAQGKLGGQETNGDGGRFLETEVLGLESDELRQRQGVGGEAGRGQRHDRVARLEPLDPRADSRDLAGALAAQGAGIAGV